MKKIVTAVFASLIASSALAADATVVTNIVDWSGFYLGGHGGYASAKIEDGIFDTGANPGPIDLTTLESDGWVGGLYIGYTHQWDRYVAGIEIDASWADLKEDITFGPTGGNTEYVAEELDFLASVRARFGAAFDNVLIYGTLGVGYAEHEFTSNNPLVGSSMTTDDWGFVVGGGVEVAATSNFLIRAEAFYYAVDPDVPVGGFVDTVLDGDGPDFMDRGGIFMGRIGASYKF